MVVRNLVTDSPGFESIQWQPQQVVNSGDMIKSYNNWENIIKKILVLHHNFTSTSRGQMARIHHNLTSCLSYSHQKGLLLLSTNRQFHRCKIFIIPFQCLYCMRRSFHSICVSFLSFFSEAKNERTHVAAFLFRHLSIKLVNFIYILFYHWIKK